MAQHVWMDMGGKTLLERPAFNPLLNRAHADALAAGIDEQRLLRRCNHGYPMLHPDTERILRRLAYLHDASL